MDNAKDLVRQPDRAPSISIEIESFNFFDLGYVKSIIPGNDRSDLGSWPLFVTFKLSGDETGLCLVALEKIPADPDGESMAVELANILASKFALGLSKNFNGLVQLNPPEVLRQDSGNHKYMATALSNAELDPSLERHYEFAPLAGTALKLRLFYLPARHGQT